MSAGVVSLTELAGNFAARKIHTFMSDIRTFGVRLLYRLWTHVSNKRRFQLLILLFLMLVASFAEIVSIGAVLPFLGVLTAPESVFEYPFVQSIAGSFGVSNPEQLMFPITVLFASAALLSGGMRLLLIWVQTRVSYAIGADFNISIYRRTLYQPYSVHIARNSSEVISGIAAKASNIPGNTIMPIFTILSGLVMMVTILLALVLIDPFAAYFTFGGFGVLYLIVALFSKKRLTLYGQRFSQEQNRTLKALQEGLGGIREVLIEGAQEIYCKTYGHADLRLRRAIANIKIIGASPRYIVESFGMILIAMLAYTLIQKSGSTAIPILGVLALSAQRLLPIIQQAYSSWTIIRGNQASLQDAMGLLDQPLPPTADLSNVDPLVFQEKLELKGLSFGYSPEEPKVLNEFDLEISKGARIGIIGRTGSGKSTLLDIIMALLRPTEGAMLVDGVVVDSGNSRSWQAQIASVPQRMFLADISILENIAFGVPLDQIDRDRVKQAAAQAQIAETIEAWPEQYDTTVGERGVRLSGGQRQRIGIARALYKQADVIVFDEATSALDSETEEAVMEAIDNMENVSITFIIVAHRLSTLRNCDRVIELVDGQMRDAGSSIEMYKSPPGHRN